MNIEKLRRLRAEANDKMKALLDGVEASGRSSLNEEETSQYDALKAEYESLGKSIKIAEEQESRETELSSFRHAAARGSFQSPTAEFPRKDFESLGEFVHAIARGGNDQRLHFEASQNMGNGSAGGFAVPSQFSTELMQVEAPGAVLQPLCTNMEAGSPPDAEITIPTLSQSSSMYGGVSLSWLDDESGSDLPETSAAIGNVKLKPHAIGGIVPITNKLLENWQAASALLQKLLSGALVHAKETAFLTGNGVAKPLGILSPSWAGLVKVARAGATAVTYADLTKVEQYAIGSNLTWIISSRARKALMDISNTTYGPLFAPGGQGMVPTLLGHPYVVNRRGAALGSLGDIILGDFSAYLIKPGSGPYIAFSEHVNFKKNESVLRIVANVDGQPWNKSTFLDVNGVTSVGPIVALDVP